MEKTRANVSENGCKTRRNVGHDYCKQGMPPERGLIPWLQSVVVDDLPKQPKSGYGTQGHADDLVTVIRDRHGWTSSQLGQSSANLVSIMSMLFLRESI